MIRRFLASAFKIEKNSLVVRKTDDDLVRYQKTMRKMELMKEMKEMEEQAEVRAQKKLNTREVRIKHFNKMINLDKTHYDKTFINDTKLEYSFLHDK